MHELAHLLLHYDPKQPIVSMEELASEVHRDEEANLFARSFFMDEIVEEFAWLRGDLFTGGIVCKEYVDLARYGSATNEWRAFYLGGGLLNVCRNSDQPTIAAKPPEGLVSACSNLGSPYYTVDFAECIDGSWTVVETGDGQVSGLATVQDPVIYYQVLANAALETGR